GQAGVRSADAPAPALGLLDAAVPKAQVLLDTPTGLELDSTGNLLVADAGRLRLLDPATGLVSALAGSLAAGFQEGDSRLVAPRARSITRQPGTDQVLVVDEPTGAIL